MVKRLSKSRRSAILEHLLALEKQIRAELGGDNVDGQAAGSKPSKGRALSSTRRGQQQSDERGQVPGFVVRSMR
ncbi:MAG: hypothetical protein ACREIV_08610 [Planctomycetaceae bacterium]